MQLPRFAWGDSGGVSIDWSVVTALVVAGGLSLGAMVKSGLGAFGIDAARTVAGVYVLGAGDRLAAVDDFERGAAGWTLTDITGTEAGFGGILGRFGGSGGAEALSRSFEFDGARAFALLEFDIHAIDDWALEEIVVFLQGRPVLTRSFTTRPDFIAAQRVDFPGDPAVVVTAAVRSEEERGFARGSPNRRDQTLRVRIVAETGGAPGSLRLGFGSTLDRPLAQASWALDNLRVIFTDNPPV